MRRVAAVLIGLACLSGATQAGEVRSGEALQEGAPGLGFVGGLEAAHPPPARAMGLGSRGHLQPGVIAQGVEALGARGIEVGDPRLSGRGGSGNGRVAHAGTLRSSVQSASVSSASRSRPAPGGSQGMRSCR